ncbi:AAA family ATPase [Xanthomonas sp. SHU 166]|uniref:AAA family ATPase n=1 Tax=Xanthomonas sp. SHU 166 TaxID=1591170 RepID=UPI0003A1230C|nr:AAA family ATPase [Xanthomonas sp. SHU 166]
MLHNLSVSGFRSLRDFDLDIKPGLNVLVGPNGAGKTNIILFFEFLRAASSETVGDAVARVGGVAQVFTKIGNLEFESSLSARLQGSIKVDSVTYNYFYSFRICFDANNQNVYFANQNLQITRFDRVREHNYISVKYSGDALHVDASKKIESFRWLSQESKSLQISGFFKDHMLAYFMRHSDQVVSEVAKDFAGRFVLNVVPSNVKKHEDSSRRPGIGTDGSGLAATLYAIQRGKSFYDERYYYTGGEVEPILPKWKSVLGLIRIAVPSISSVEVVNDPFENTLRCKFRIGEGEGASVQPLSALSDGTVKWISLVLRLVTSNAALLLEEPENYLHPLMQREIVRLLRDSVSDGGFVIVSTHSETLINSLDVEEMIVVNYTKEGTKAFRVSNVDDLKAEVNNTGFGLGYYYLANALEI